jgi:hypothetical protein
LLLCSLENTRWSPLENRIDKESYRGVLKEAEDKLQHFVVEDGVVT